MGASIVLGMTIGAITGGVLMKIGRRRSQFICIFLGLVGVRLTLITNIWALLVGRFLFGVSVGLFSAIIPRYVEEMVPAHLFDRAAPIFNFS